MPAPTSFSFLRTVHNVLHSTFRSACEAYGLLQGDNEYDISLQEAALYQNAYALRSLFITIMTHCQPANPCGLLNRHRKLLEEGCAYRLTSVYNVAEPCPEQVWDLALSDLRTLAEKQGKSMQELGLPSPSENFMLSGASSDLAAEQAYDKDVLARVYTEGITKANVDQRHAVQEILLSVNERQGRMFFLDGPGGTGKTFVESLCLASVRAQGGIAVAVASSGVAAQLLPGGRTAHSRFKIPIVITETSTCSVPAQSGMAQLFRETVLIIWDEAVMQSKETFLVVDRMLRDVRNCPHPFGGVTMLFAGEKQTCCRLLTTTGDLRQCLPVIPNSTRAETIQATITNLPCWPKVTVLPLTINMRLGLDCDAETVMFANWLLEIGEGRSPLTNGKVGLPDNVILGPGSTRDDLINFIYSSVINLDPNNMEACCEMFGNNVILAPHNASVDSINTSVLALLNGQTHCMNSADTAVTEDGQPSELPTEYLNTLAFPNFPPHRLQLKIGCAVILLRNLAPGDGLCNGTRLIVKDIQPKVLQCRIMTGSRNGDDVLIPRISLIMGASLKLPFEVHRLQFPVRLSFAMSINKAQGQSLRHVGLDLSLPVFSHGQLYVALSRATQHDSVKVLLPTGETCHTVNVVYQEVFANHRS